MFRNLPRELTSYDLLKMLAVVLMVIDHVGHHFYPDEMWFRVLGRLCVPIWFFLIGYANTTRINPSLWVGGGLVAISAMIAGQYLLPLNILFTIIFIRLFRDRVAAYTFYTPESLRGMFLILFFLTLPTAMIAEYGTMGVLFAMIGYARRHDEAVEKRIEPKYIMMFAVAVFTGFYLWQGVSMPSLNTEQALVMLGGLCLVGGMLWKFKPVVYIDSQRVMSRSFVGLFAFFGRWTLEIYVVHIIIFRGVCMYLYPEKYGFWDWNILPAGLMQTFM